MKSPRRSSFVAFCLVGTLVPTAYPQVIFNEILYNPAGDDFGHEQLELKNTGGTPVDLSNYVLCSSFLYSDPSDFVGVVVAPGQLLVVHLALPGANDANNVYLPNFPPVIPGFFDGTLGNDNDEISLYDCGADGCFEGLGEMNRMVDFVQWGVTGAGTNQERLNVAADPTRTEGALWSSAATLDFAPIAGGGQSIAFDGSNGGGGQLTLGSDFHVGTPTIGQETQCFSDADCNDDIPCTDNHCTNGTCSFTPNSANCPSNGLFCDGVEICSATQGCISTGSPCTSGQICVEATDSCVACQTNAHCNDNNACTTDTCSNGNCVFTPITGCCTTAAQCNDGNNCTTDSCENMACVHAPIAGCTSCTSEADCDDANPCTNEICLVGTCMYSNNHNDCDDDDPCTFHDICADGECLGQPSPTCCMSDNDCDDNNPCTDDSCSNSQCDHTNNTSSCDDQDPCTDADICTNGTCVGTLQSNCCAVGSDCDDNDQCTQDVCANSRCQNNPIANCGNSSGDGGTDIPPGSDVPGSDGSGGQMPQMKGLCGSVGLIPAVFLFVAIAGVRARRLHQR